MRGKIGLVSIISAAVLASAVPVPEPQPARYDQRQTGTYNLHLNLQDGQVYAVVKDVLVSAPVKNFAVTLKGPIASPTTESPRNDARTGIHSHPSKGVIPQLYSKTPSAEIPPKLITPNVEIPTDIKTPIVTATSPKTPNIDVDQTSKMTSQILKEPNFELVSGSLSASNQTNGTSNNRRQNNKVASQIVTHQIAEPTPPPPPPPPRVQTLSKPTLSPLPPLPSSIIAALTDQRTTNQRIEALPDEVNEIYKMKTSHSL